MNRRQVLGWISVPMLVGATFAGGAWYGEQRLRAQHDWAEGRLLSSAIDSVRANALDSLPNDELIRRAVSGMLRELHDPYAALMRPEGFQRYRGTLQGEGQGFGIGVRRQAGTVRVGRVAPGSPAATGGVRPGDRILSVNDVPITEGWGRRAGDTSSTTLPVARLRIVRAPSDDTLTLTLRKAAWHSPAVTDVGMLTDSVGYLRLTTATSRSAAELETAVGTLVKRGATSLVLDLRGNAGGLFEEGVKAAGLFLPRNALVASLDARRGAAPERHANKHSRWPTMPIALLVDANTASAAEVIAAALRDHGRALLVGAPTYGKGVVQRVVTLTPDISLRLTTARWLTPKGESLERRQVVNGVASGGLVPDVLLDDAARKDPFSLPREWPRDAVTELSMLADSATLHALRDGWGAMPVTVLESRLRNAVAVRVPRAVRGETSRANWVNVATRLATVRTLEVGGSPESLLRYNVRDDAALRAGLDAIAPGSELTRIVPVALPATSKPSRPAARPARAAAPTAPAER